jgi:hypothetical protein
VVCTLRPASIQKRRGTLLAGGADAVCAHLPFTPLLSAGACIDPGSFIGFGHGNTWFSDISENPENSKIQGTST